MYSIKSLIYFSGPVSKIQDAGLFFVDKKTEKGMYKNVHHCGKYNYFHL